jgi:uncharacterized damage-inducible protein DinB
MTIADAILPEFDHEMAMTRTILERVPLEKDEWTPHPKSRKLGELARHVAALPGWGTLTLTANEFDVGAPNSFPNPTINSTEELLAAFDEGVARARAALAGSSDDDMRTDWTFRRGEHVVFTQPRAAVLRSAVLSHIIHHRAQLGVYLRLLDVELPPIYGPTADMQVARVVAE